MSKKNIKTIGNTTKRITLPKKIVTSNPQGKKKQIETTIDRLNRASYTGKNLQKNKKYKCDQFGQNKTTKKQENKYRKYSNQMIIYLIQKNKKNQVKKQTNNCDNCDNCASKTDMSTFYKI